MIFSPGDDDDLPCFQYCRAGSYEEEKVMYDCLHRGRKVNFGCTEADADGNIIPSGSVPARSLSVSGMLVVGLVLIGMLQV